MNKNVYTFNDIQQAFTDKVSEYISNGYTIRINPMQSSYKGGQVDFIVNNDIHRIVVYADIIENKTEPSEPFLVYKIEVLVFAEACTKVSPVLFNKDAEIIYSKTFYKINKSNSDRKTAYVTDISTALKLHTLVSERYERKIYEKDLITHTITLTPKNRKIILNLVRTHKNCKSVKADMIKSVTRYPEHYRIAIADKQREITISFNK